MTQAVVTLYEKLGGSQAIETIVGEFFKKVVADPQLKGYFSKTNMTRLTRTMSQFVGMTLGGSIKYSGRSMQAVHHGLKITRPHFDLFVGHLAETLRWATVPPDDVWEVMRSLEPLVADIVLS